MGAPTVRSFSAAFDPLRLIEQFPGRYPGILESGARASLRVTHDRFQNREDARFDILPMAIEPYLCAHDGAAREQGAADFLNEFRRWMRCEPGGGGNVDASLPFRGGWFVFLGYEIAAEIEPTLSLPANPEGLNALALRCPAAWIYDRQRESGWAVCEPSFEWLLERFERDVELTASLPQSAAESLSASAHGLSHIIESNPESFVAQVRRCLEYIAAGDIYQANISRAWRVESDGALNAVDVYRGLRRANPAPFSALLRFRDFAVASSSPERLFTLNGQSLSSRPIAGTRPRASTHEADEALLAELLSNEKERAEHVMLIDLVRNDLGKVCVGGSVQVDEFMSVETYAHVHHIVSNVSGEIAPSMDVVDTIRAVFPGGTVTGVPKFRCMQIIAELEGEGRGAYTGSIGFVNRDGSADFNILIRTVTVRHGIARFRAGAGIVADSDPMREVDETRAKAEGLCRAFR